MSYGKTMVQISEWHDIGVATCQSRVFTTADLSPSAEMAIIMGCEIHSQRLFEPKQALQGRLRLLVDEREAVNVPVHLFMGNSFRMAYVKLRDSVQHVMRELGLKPVDDAVFDRRPVEAAVIGGGVLADHAVTRERLKEMLTELLQRASEIDPLWASFVAPIALEAGHALRVELLDVPDWSALVCSLHGVGKFAAGEIAVPSGLLES